MSVYKSLMLMKPSNVVEVGNQHDYLLRMSGECDA